MQAEAIAQTDNRPAVVERLAAMGVEIVRNTPEEFARAIKADVVKRGKVVRESGVKVD